jgi:hypothetical protein
VGRTLDLFDSVKVEEKKGLSELLNPVIPDKKKVSFSSDPGLWILDSRRSEKEDSQR